MALPLLMIGKFAGVAFATALAGALGQWIDERGGKPSDLSDEQKDQLRDAIEAEGNSIEEFEKAENVYRPKQFKPKEVF